MPGRKGRSGQKKGAIEMSLGFIVAVVFAVVLLSLALMWIQGIFKGFGGITADLEQQAHNEIQKTFQTTENNFAVWPSKYDLERGFVLKMSAGIKNDDRDGQDHKFVINVIPATASEGPCPGGDLDMCGSLKSDMQKWASWDKQAGVIQIGRVGYKSITISIPQNAVSGIYIFNVVACKEMYSFSECTSQTLNWGGSAQQITLTVK